MTALSTTVTLNWVNRKGCDRDCDVEVSFGYDGSEITILSSRVIGCCDLDDWTFAELLHEAVAEVADDVLAEWLADQDCDDSVAVARAA